MTRYLLDTNVVSAALRGSPGIDQRLSALDAADWCISAITRSELRYGLALKPEALRLARLVEGFLQLATTAPWDEAAAEVHGRLRATLRQRGTPIGDFDEMIAAHALSLGAVLVTRTKRQAPGFSPGSSVQAGTACQLMCMQIQFSDGSREDPQAADQGQARGCAVSDGA